MAPRFATACQAQEVSLHNNYLDAFLLGDEADGEEEEEEDDDDVVPCLDLISDQPCITT